MPVTPRPSFHRISGWADGPPRTFVLDNNVVSSLASFWRSGNKDTPEHRKIRSLLEMMRDGPAQATAWPGALEASWHRFSGGYSRRHFWDVLQRAESILRDGPVSIEALFDQGHDPESICALGASTPSDMLTEAIRTVIDCSVVPNYCCALKVLALNRKSLVGRAGLTEFLRWMDEDLDFAGGPAPLFGALALAGKGAVSSMLRTGVLGLEKADAGQAVWAGAWDLTMLHLPILLSYPSFSDMFDGPFALLTGDGNLADVAPHVRPVLIHGGPAMFGLPEDVFADPSSLPEFELFAARRGARFPRPGLASSPANATAIAQSLESDLGIISRAWSVSDPVDVAEPYPAEALLASVDSLTRFVADRRSWGEEKLRSVTDGSSDFGRELTGAYYCLDGLVSDLSRVEGRTEDELWLDLRTQWAEIPGTGNTLGFVLATRAHHSEFQRLAAELITRSPASRLLALAAAHEFCRVVLDQTARHRSTTAGELMLVLRKNVVNGLAGE